MNINRVEVSPGYLKPDNSDSASNTVGIVVPTSGIVTSDALMSNQIGTNEAMITPKIEIISDEYNYNANAEIITSDPEPLYASERTTCKFCCITFVNFDDFTNHIITHAPPKYAYMCVVCDETFESKLSLQTHFLSHNIKKADHANHTIHAPPKHVFMCVVCDETFDSKLMLKTHFMSHNMEQVININENLDNTVKGLNCNLCESYFENSQSFYNHLPKHTLQMTYSCHVCPMSFSKCELIMEHLKEHDGDVLLSYHTQAPVTKLNITQLNLLTNKLRNLDIRNIFYCNFCSMLVLERMDIHMKRNHSEFQTNIYRCHVCGKYFETYENLRKHFETFMKNTDFPEEMDSNHSSNSQLKIALRANGIPPSCSANPTYENIISFEEKNSSSEDSHSENFGMDGCSTSLVHDQQILDKVQSPKYTCPICSDNETYSSENNYRKHLKKHKCTCEKPECVICSLKPLNYCSSCHKFFASETTLQNHQKTHKSTRQKKVICEICGKKFFNYSGLRKHLHIHDGGGCRCGVCQLCLEKNPKYQCHVCKNIFLSDNSLKRHSVVHFGEKLHVCDVCGKAFSESNNLKEHVKSHEQTNLDNSEIIFLNNM